MKRGTGNIIVDAVSLIVFMSMITTGLILNFILPPGSGRVEMLLEGDGRRERTIDLFMGLARHEWGQIHLYISLAFLILLVVHLYLHWNWIVAVSVGTSTAPQPRRRRMIAAGIILFITLTLLFPWLGKRQTYTKTEFMQLRGLAK